MTEKKTALVTGASRGLGLALARSLSADGWRLVIDARCGADLASAAAELGLLGSAVRAVAGDVSQEGHRLELLAAARDLGGLDLVVHNASLLGPSPQPALADYPLDVLERVYAVNVLAPLRLTQLVLPVLKPGARHERHRHHHCDEFFIVLKGHGHIYTDDGEAPSGEGDVVYSPRKGTP